MATPEPQRRSKPTTHRIARNDILRPEDADIVVETIDGIIKWRHTEGWDDEVRAGISKVFDSGSSAPQYPSLVSRMKVSGAWSGASHHDAPGTRLTYEIAGHERRSEGVRPAGTHRAASQDDLREAVTRHTPSEPGFVGQIINGLAASVIFKGRRLGRRSAEKGTAPKGTRR